jgi:hypothetical protein
VIAVLLHDLRWRLAAVVLIALGLLWWEVEAQAHGALEGAEAAPASLAAPMAYLAALAMIVLLAGFVSTDRREGYARLFFAHPTSPLAFYALRWVLAYAVALLASVLFLLVVQAIVWGGVRGGLGALLLPALTALIFGGIMAFFSTALPRGDAWAGLLLFLPTLFPQVLLFLLQNVGPALREATLFLLPPQTTALQVVYENLLVGQAAWGAAAFAAGYGVVWLGAAVALLRVREWP